MITSLSKRHYLKCHYVLIYAWYPTISLKKIISWFAPCQDMQSHYGILTKLHVLLPLTHNGHISIYMRLINCHFGLQNRYLKTKLLTDCSTGTIIQSCGSEQSALVHFIKMLSVALGKPMVMRAGNIDFLQVYFSS